MDLLSMRDVVGILRGRDGNVYTGYDQYCISVPLSML